MPDSDRLSAIEDWRARWRSWSANARDAAQPLAPSVAGFVRREIERQGLDRGDRLPSVRMLADACATSRDTIVRAYELLLAEGEVRPRGGAGYFVSRPPVVQSAGPRVDRRPSALDPWDWRWLLTADLPAMRRPGTGIVHPDLAPNEEIAKAARTALRVRQDIFADYNEVSGYLPLREQIRQRLHQAGVAATSDEIMTSVGATGALSILIRALVRPGDLVLVEEPGPFVHRELAMSQGARIERVRRDADGPDMARLRRLCAHERPKLFLLSSLVQNPTGLSITPARAHELIRLSDETGLILVDDNSYAELASEADGPAMPLAALTRSEAVVHVSSLTRILAPGMSVGFCLASGPILDQLLLFKSAQLGAGSVVPERVLYRFLAEGRYERILARLRQRIAERRRSLTQRLRDRGYVCPRVAQGLFVWVPVSRRLLGARHARASIESGYIAAPDFLFGPPGHSDGHLRLNVTTTSDAYLDWLGRHLES